MTVVTRVYVASIAACLFWPFGARAQEPAELPPLKPEDFAYGYPLTIEGSAAHELVLPLGVYADLTREDRRDLCVFDAQGQVVPFVLFHPPAPSAELVAKDVPWFALPPQPPGKEQDLTLFVRRDQHGMIAEVRGPAQPAPARRSPRAWLLDLSGIVDPVASVTPIWSETTSDFLGEVDLSASEDLAHWSHVTSASVAQLRAGEKRISPSALALPAITAKYLRLALSHETPADLTLLGVSLTVTHPRAESEATSITLRAKDGEPPLRFTFSIPGPLPVVAARVVFAEGNTLVEGVLEAASLHSDSFVERFRGAMHSVAGSNSEAWIPLEDGDRTLRLTLTDKGSARTARPELKLQVRPHHLQFLPRGTAAHLLAVGSVRRDAEPVSGVLPVRDGTKSIALSAARRELGGVAMLRAPPAPPVPMPWRTYALWGVLILATALFAWLAWRLVRDMKAAP